MTTLKSWISAARLRTLPLSISGIIMGSSYAYLLNTGGYYDDFRMTDEGLLLAPGIDLNRWMLITLLALVTTLGFQILSNFANDYGDGVKGTDNQDRIGPARALQTGAITPQAMKKGIILTAVHTFISALALINVSLGVDKILPSLIFIGLGIAAIWAAIKYTVGENAYGYRGLGDVFVFIFFGPVSVLGIFYLISGYLNYYLVLPSITIGLLSVAVLNLNNMRDYHSDKKVGKNTIVVHMGLPKAKVLHYYILGTAFIAQVSFLTLNHTAVVREEEIMKSILYFVPLLAFIPVGIHAIKVYKIDEPKGFDPELKKVALSTFFLAIFTFITIWLIS